MKKRNVMNWRVEVIPERYWRTNDTRREDCDELAKQIRRHVDGIDDIVVVNDVEEVCEFCGSQWTEDSFKYNGGCCDKDEANNPCPDGGDCK